MPYRKKTKSGYVQPSLFAGQGLGFFPKKKGRSKRVLATEGKVFPLFGSKRYDNPLGINMKGRRAASMRLRRRSG
jgi:hypothetical protein